MPPRDDQDYEQRRQQIIDGALKAFGEKGYERATNKDIAEAAGIGSPGLIYHYFKDKEDLFFQVVQQRFSLLKLLERPEEFMELPPREALLLVALSYTRVVNDRRLMAAFRLLIGEVLRRPAVAEIANRLLPRRAFLLLTRYLERQMDLGRMRRMEPGAAVRCFVGPLVVYLITREVLLQPDSQTLTPERMAEVTVDIFLQGMAAES